MSISRSILIGVATTALFAAAAARPAAAQQQADETAQHVARAQLVDAEGNVVATATLRETAGHGVLIRLEAERLPAGEHAFHIHQTGRCEPPGFESAGGHYAPRGRQHGFLVPAGPHAGDLPNIHVPADGRLVIEVVAPDVTLRPGAPNTLFDEDGSALVIHAGRDDYTSQPAGDAGGRIACGVIRR
ncbi:MAG: superoxide dismutase family protein [bacterium]|jgi:Cu-Zn family superoxide dismutase|nr:MAG: CRISPR-associated protein Csn1 [bacterium]